MTVFEKVERVTISFSERCKTKIDEGISLKWTHGFNKVMLCATCSTVGKIFHVYTVKMKINGVISQSVEFSDSKTVKNAAILLIKKEATLAFYFLVS